MVSLGDNLIASQFFLTLGSDLSSLDGQHVVIGQVTEGMEILRYLNDAICDDTHRPYQDIRITHTVVLDDPFENPRSFRAPSRSPSPTAERLQGGRIGADEDIDDTAGKTEQEVHEMLQEREAKARATILEIVGDLPDADVAPPENVLFVARLNPVTSDDDLEIIFSRFGKVKGCEVIREKNSGESLQYAFVEFEDSKACENAYFKMDNVLIDDRRIHVDFSQSVAKVQWKGKGRGMIWKDGNKTNRLNFNDLKDTNSSGNGQNYRERRQPNRRDDYENSRRNQRHSRSPNSHKTETKRGYQREPYRRNIREPSRSKSRDRTLNRKRSRNRSRDKTDRRRHSVSRSRSRSANVKRRRPVSRSRSPDRNRFASRYDRHVDRRQSPNSQRRGSDRFRSSDIACHSRKSSPSPASKRQSPAREQRKSKKSKRSSDSDSSTVAARKKSKKSKNKRKKKKSKKSKKASTTESSSSDSSSSSS